MTAEIRARVPHLYLVEALRGPAGQPLVIEEDGRRYIVVLLPIDE